ncbi:MAG: hypothetical protein II841_12080 [Bacteroidales bacterium]|nr:hypothetical protein [Bacteroidales bacterium]MBR0052529.1 hypothetical protein [Bacteroidales bacterium]
MYALADCNKFFASCERVFRPELNGKPVIVLSNNDGCAVARLGLRVPAGNHREDALPSARLPDVEGTQVHPLHRVGGHDRTAQDHLRVAELQ